MTLPDCCHNREKLIEVSICRGKFGSSAWRAELAIGSVVVVVGSAFSKTASGAMLLGLPKCIMCLTLHPLDC